MSAPPAAPPPTRRARTRKPPTTGFRWVAGRGIYWFQSGPDVLGVAVARPPQDAAPGDACGWAFASAVGPAEVRPRVAALLRGMLDVYDPPRTVEEAMRVASNEMGMGPDMAEVAEEAAGWGFGGGAKAQAVSFIERPALGTVLIAVKHHKALAGLFDGLFELTAVRLGDAVVRPLDPSLWDETRARAKARMEAAATAPAVGAAA